MSDCGWFQWPRNRVSGHQHCPFYFGDARAGTGWLRYVQAVAHGGVGVVGISQSHRLEVDVIFGYLIGGDAASVWMAIDVVSVMIALALAIYAWQAFWDARWRSGFLEASLLILLFAAVPPLVGFALYFCCVHSARHLWSVWNAVRQEFPRHMLSIGAMAFTFVSWGAGATAFWWCASFMIGIGIAEVVYRACCTYRAAYDIG